MYITLLAISFEEPWEHHTLAACPLKKVWRSSCWLGKSSIDEPDFVLAKKNHMHGTAPSGIIVPIQGLWKKDSSWLIGVMKKIRNSLNAQRSAFKSPFEEDAALGARKPDYAVSAHPFSFLLELDRTAGYKSSQPRVDYSLSRCQFEAKGKVLFHFVLGTATRLSLIMLTDQKSLRGKAFFEHRDGPQKDQCTVC